MAGVEPKFATYLFQNRQVWPSAHTHKSIKGQNILVEVKGNMGNIEKVVETDSDLGIRFNPCGSNAVQNPVLSHK